MNEAVEGSVETSEQTSQQGEVSTETASRPEYVPEKYWNGERGETNIEALAKGYNEIASAFGKKQETLESEVSEKLKAQLREGVPETAEGYEFTPSEGLIPEGVEFKLNKENPQMKEFGTLAHEIGLTPEQYNKVVGLYVQNELALMPNKSAEVQKLGENGQARVERVDMWSKANLSETSYNALVGQAISGEFIIAMEELIDKTKDVNLEAEGDTKHGKLDLNELQQMQKDPRYRDPRHRDPSFVKRVEEGFAALVG